MGNVVSRVGVVGVAGGFVRGWNWATSLNAKAERLQREFTPAKLKELCMEMKNDNWKPRNVAANMIAKGICDLTVVASLVSAAEEVLSSWLQWMWQLFYAILRGIDTTSLTAFFEQLGTLLESSISSANAFVQRICCASATFRNHVSKLDFILASSLPTIRGCLLTFVCDVWEVLKDVVVWCQAKLETQVYEYVLQFWFVMNAVTEQIQMDGVAPLLSLLAQCVRVHVLHAPQL